MGGAAGGSTHRREQGAETGKLLSEGAGGGDRWDGRGPRATTGGTPWREDSAGLGTGLGWTSLRGWGDVQWYSTKGWWRPTWRIRAPGRVVQSGAGGWVARGPARTTQPAGLTDPLSPDLQQPGRAALQPRAGAGPARLARCGQTQCGPMGGQTTWPRRVDSTNLSCPAVPHRRQPAPPAAAPRAPERPASGCGGTGRSRRRWCRGRPGSPRACPPVDRARRDRRWSTPGPAVRRRPPRRPLSSVVLPPRAGGQRRARNAAEVGPCGCGPGPLPRAERHQRARGPFSRRRWPGPRRRQPGVCQVAATSWRTEHRRDGLASRPSHEAARLHRAVVGIVRSSARARCRPAHQISTSYGFCVSEKIAPSVWCRRASARGHVPAA